MSIAQILPTRATSRRAEQRRPISRAPLVLSVVDTRTGTLHRVPVEIAALHRYSGRYPALCGSEVPAASLTTPAARTCRVCATELRRAVTAADPADPEQRHPLLRRLRGPRRRHRRTSR